MFEPKKYSILLVDDEPDILEFLSYNLRSEGYMVFTCNNGAEVIKKVHEVTPDLILLDIMMPEMDGIETCEKLRKIKGLEHVLIMFLTARGEDYSQVAGFDAGGDDYVTKPIKPKIIKKRIRAILKRVKKEEKSLQENGILEYENLRIDPERFIVVYKDQKIVLPRKEFTLLHLLASNPSRVYTRNEIYSHLWGEDVIVGDRTIDVHIRRLREKIGNGLITTIKGVGYKFEP
jgi:two-component system, OmpR family, alkaline phosphatase synthesis response regulator PhoP